MGKFNTLEIKFDKEYLSTLTEDPDSGVCKQNCKYHIALHPAQFTDFGQSIKDELGRKIAKYDDIFNGIMLGYENVKLQSNLGVIGIDNCYVHVDVQGDFFVFKPEIGMVLKGIVTRTTKDHVGCLVYSTFNISLPKPEDDNESWIGNKASISNEVLFKIIYVDLNARLPYIRGELLSILNDSTNAESSSSKRTKKLNKKIKFENDIEEENSILPELESEPRKKRKKKHKKDNESIEYLEMNGEHIEEEQTTKKRKRNKFKDNEEVDEALSKPKKKRKKSHNEDSESMENLDIKEEEFDTEMVEEVKLEYLKIENGATPTKSKKKSIKISNERDETPESVEIKVEDLVRDEINKVSKRHKKKKKQNSDNDEEERLEKKERRKEKKKKLEQDEDDVALDIKSLFDSSFLSLKSNSFQSNTIEKLTPNSKEKHKKSPSKNSLSLETFKIKREIIQEEPEEKKLSNESKTRNKKTKQTFDEGDEDVHIKQEKRKEKKKKHDTNESLDSLDLNLLFHNTSASLNSSYSRTMANDDDRGKKRRKSNSVSHEIFSANVKLEADSELEEIITGKKRKRSKSIST